MDTMMTMGLSGLGELGTKDKPLKPHRAPRAPKPKQNSRPLMAKPIHPAYTLPVVRVELPDGEPTVVPAPPMALGTQFQNVSQANYPVPQVKVTKLDKLLNFGGGALDRLFAAKAGGYAPQQQQQSASPVQNDGGDGGGGGVRDAGKSLGAGAGGFVDSILQTVKDNPLPFLIGGGALVLYKMQPGGRRR
jgi:hypothetical protein